MLRFHKELFLHSFHAERQFSSSAVVGLNKKARVSLAMSYGYHSAEIIRLVLYPALQILRNLLPYTNSADEAFFI